MISFYKKSLNRFAFTLIELLVSISIFMIITAMVIANFRIGQYRDELVGAAEVLMTATREMQTATTSGRTVDCDRDAGTPASTVNGYGVNVTSDLVVTRYADCDDSRKFELEDASPEGDDVVILEDTNISSNILLVGVVPSPDVVFPIDFIFSPISELVAVNRNDPAPVTSDVVITLEHARTSQTINFYLNPVSGRIYYAN